MRRGTVILVVLLLLVAGEVAILTRGIQQSGGSVGLAEMQLAVAVGAAFLATGIALVSIVSLRRHCGRLSRRLAEMHDDGKLARAGASHPDLVPLVDAINGTVDLAEQALADAAMQVKEMDIQLKVATARRQHAEAILYSISDAVLVTDPFDDLVLANDCAARTFGFDLEVSHRAPIDRVLSDAKMVELIRDMRQSDSKSGRRIVEHALRTPDGERTFKVTLSCVADQADQPAGVVAVLHDMTREKEVSQMKNDFVSHVSHELRTPLASIKAYTEMLVDGEAEDEKTQREFYEIIQNEANRLGRLIDNILNVARIESGLIHVNKQPQSLMVLLKEAIEVIQPQAKLKQITIDEQLTPAFYQTSGDRDMLYQAALNLLSNAVKYTSEGGRITVQTLVDESKKKVTTLISDTGVGIPPKDLPFVFDKFYRAEANNRMAKGTGLGLSLVKQIIETVHRGRVFVESQVGKGSTFGFELDLV